jgi:apolipoprotein N-acyltransferase
MDRIAHAIAALTGWRRRGVALLAGCASALGLAPVDAFPVLFVTLPVFVWLLDGAMASAGTGWPRRFRAGAMLGWWFGFGYFLAGLWWIGAAFLVDGDQFAWALPIAVTILPAGLALFWGLGTGLAALPWRPGWPRILILAAALAGVEWLRGHVLTGFPWNALGQALAPTAMMMQSAALVGLWGLTLGAFVIFAAPAALWPSGASPRRGARIFVSVAALLLAAHVGYGALRLGGAAPDGDDAPRLRIVQPSLDQSEKWQADNEDEIVARYLRLSSAPGEDGRGLADTAILVWPESAFPFLLSERPDVLAAIADLLPEGSTLLTGAVRAESSADPYGDAFNSVLLIDTAGTIAAAYDKVHLVPFGEYLPFQGALRALGLRQLVALPEGFVPGAARMMLAVPGAPPVAPLICYEIIFPGAALPEGPRPGWILNLTNDAWFGATPGPYQHFMQSRLRAVETGLPVIRAANSGISAIIDAYGRVQKSLPLERVGVVDGFLPPVAPATLYTQIGDVIFLSLLLICGVVGCMAPRHGDIRQN